MRGASREAVDDHQRSAYADDEGEYDLISLLPPADGTDEVVDLHAAASRHARVRRV